MTDRRDDARWRLLVALLREPVKESRRLAARLERLPATRIRCCPADGSGADGATYRREVITKPRRRR